jgi:hypothetical protein
VKVQPNPAAIAWYVEEAQRLLEDQQRRAELLRARGGQIAGFGAAVLALIGGNAATILEATNGSVRTWIGMALLAALTCLAVAVAVAIWGAIKPRPFVALAADEITNYTSRRFLNEPDLWRIHIRSLRSLEAAARRMEKDSDVVADAIAISLYAFLAGLGFSLILLGTLILELI